MPLVLIVVVVVSTFIVGGKELGNQINRAFDLDAKQATAKIQNAIDEGNYEKANDLYVKKQDARVGSTAYENLKSVREQVEYYRRYRASIDLEKDPNPNKDWGFIINNLENMPPNFKYKKEVENLIAETKSKINSPQQQVLPQTTKNTQTQGNQSLIDCTGPDGKQFKTTQKECDSFNAAWVNKKSVTTPQNIQNKGLTAEEIKNIIFLEQIKESINQGKNELKLEDNKRCLDKVATDRNQCYGSCESKATYDENACEYAYGANGVISKLNTELYGQCLSEKTRVYLDCKSKCNSSYDFSACPR